MGKAATEQEKLRQAKARLRRIQHYEQVTQNVSQSCRFFGVSRRQFYTWLHRYRGQGLEGLKNLRSGSRRPHLATPPSASAPSASTAPSAFASPGQSVQVDVKHLKLRGRRFYQFTAADEATRRVLRIYTHNSIPNAIAFMDEVRQRLPMAIQRVQTACYERLVKPVSSLLPAPLGCPIE